MKKKIGWSISNKMDTRSGEIYSEADAKALSDIDQAYLRQMGRHPTPTERKQGKVGRNSSCPCGSGKKFKMLLRWISLVSRQTSKAHNLLLTRQDTLKRTQPVRNPQDFLHRTARNARRKTARRMQSGRQASARSLS